jgi:hypothetical protein
MCVCSASEGGQEKYQNKYSGQLTFPWGSDTIFSVTCKTRGRTGCNITRATPPAWLASNVPGLTHPYYITFSSSCNLCLTVQPCTSVLWVSSVTWHSAWCLGSVCWLQHPPGSWGWPCSCKDHTFQMEGGESVRMLCVHVDWTPPGATASTHLPPPGGGREGLVIIPPGITGPIHSCPILPGRGAQPAPYCREREDQLILTCPMPPG